MNMKKMMNETTPKYMSIATLLLRISIGMIMVGAGAGKFFGMFGGYGWSATVQSFGSMGISEPLAFISTAIELVGGILMILGLLTRPASFFVGLNMLVATVLTLPMGFLTVSAYPFSLAIGSIAVILLGPMEYSLDTKIFDKK